MKEKKTGDIVEVRGRAARGDIIIRYESGLRGRKSSPCSYFEARAPLLVILARLMAARQHHPRPRRHCCPRI